MDCFRILVFIEVARVSRIGINRKDRLYRSLSPFLILLVPYLSRLGRGFTGKPELRLKYEIHLGGRDFKIIIFHEMKALLFK